MFVFLMLKWSKFIDELLTRLCIMYQPKILLFTKTDIDTRVSDIALNIRLYPEKLETVIDIFRMCMLA